MHNNSKINKVIERVIIDDDFYLNAMKMDSSNSSCITI